MQSLHTYSRHIKLQLDLSLLLSKCESLNFFICNVGLIISQKCGKDKNEDTIT